ncbi:MAG: glycosyltransferase [Actinomycetota bacterium]
MSVPRRTADATSSREPAPGDRLRILVVSFRFPPFNSAGAVSIGKAAKYLVALGHEVQVITAGDQQLPTNLPMEVDPGTVVATRWFNPMRVAEPIAGGRQRVSATGFSAGRRHDRLVHRVGRLYRSVMIPDREIGWAWPAVRAGRRLISTWRPDVIFASAPPNTSLVVAKALSRGTGIPWVAGLGDLWSDNPYNPYRGTPLARLDRSLESRVLRAAAGCVVTTDEAGELIRGRYGTPTATVMNGFDADDARTRSGPSRPNELRIVYTGILMHDRRDPTALFRAMRRLRDEGDTVVADFYGRDAPVAEKAAGRVGVTDLVRSHGPISHEESLQAQRDADVLLLLQWNDPAERITCPLKIFEYAAALRPVLGLGPDDGVVARLLRQFDMGMVLQHPNDIARELRRWTELKARLGHVPDVAPVPPGELSRERQVATLASFLADIVDLVGSRRHG